MAVYHAAHGQCLHLSCGIRPKDFHSGAFILSTAGKEIICHITANNNVISTRPDALAQFKSRESFRPPTVVVSKGIAVQIVPLSYASRFNCVWKIQALWSTIPFCLLRYLDSNNFCRSSDLLEGFKIKFYTLISRIQRWLIRKCLKLIKEIEFDLRNHYNFHDVSEYLSVMQIALTTAAFLLGILLLACFYSSLKEACKLQVIQNNVLYIYSNEVTVQKMFWNF